MRALSNPGRAQKRTRVLDSQIKYAGHWRPWELNSPGRCDRLLGRSTQVPKTGNLMPDYAAGKPPEPFEGRIFTSIEESGHVRDHRARRSALEISGRDRKRAGGRSRAESARRE